MSDSIALWHRQDETPYLLEPEPRTGSGGAAALASPPSDSHQISSDPEPDADDWDEVSGTRSGRGSVLGVEGPGAEPLTLDEISWEDTNNEVDEAMNDSDAGEDDDDESPGRRSRGGSVRGASEDEWTDETNSVISSATSSPRVKRKRVRSLTPSELSQLVVGTGVGGGGDEDGLRSPLAKRKKLVADRSGASRLKEAFTAEQLRAPSRGRDEDEESVRSRQSSPMNGVGEDDDDEDGDDEEDGSSVNMLEDDFLARELEAEWG